MKLALGIAIIGALIILALIAQEAAKKGISLPLG